MPEPPNSDERLKGALLVAATLTAAIRLRGEPIANTPKVIAAIHDSVKLARMILRTLNARLIFVRTNPRNPPAGGGGPHGYQNHSLSARAAPLFGVASSRGNDGMPTGLVFIGGVLVVIVGLLIFFLIRRQKPPEPPHFGK